MQRRNKNVGFGVRPTRVRIPAVWLWDLLKVTYKMQIKKGHWEKTE